MQDKRRIVLKLVMLKHSCCQVSEVDEGFHNMICTWTKGSTTFAVDEGFHLEFKRHDTLAVDEEFPVVRCGRKVPLHVLWTKGSINFVAFECPSEDTTKVYLANANTPCSLLF